MLKKLTLWILCITVCVLGGAVALGNGQPVNFDYVLGVTEGPFVFFLFIALLMGVLLGLCVASIWVFRQHRHIKKLERNKALVQKELDNLRTLRSERS